MNEFKRKQTEMESECFQGSGDGREQKMAVEIEQEDVQNLRLAFLSNQKCFGLLNSTFLSLKTAEIVNFLLKFCYKIIIFLL